jgi:hypothetical protein
VPDKEFSGTDRTATRSGPIQFLYEQIWTKLLKICSGFMSLEVTSAIPSKIQT